MLPPVLARCGEAGRQCLRPIALEAGHAQSDPLRRASRLLIAVARLAPRPRSPSRRAEFYRGKTVTLVVSSATGGGYDTLSRVIASHLGRHIPGTPQVVVRNMAGAGGIVATNHLYNVAAKDGTVVGGVQNNTPFEPLFGTKAATYDPLKFNWLGHAIDRGRDRDACGTRRRSTPGRTPAPARSPWARRA